MAHRRGGWLRAVERRSWHAHPAVLREPQIQAEAAAREEAQAETQAHTLPDTAARPSPEPDPGHADPHAVNPIPVGHSDRHLTSWALERAAATWFSAL